MRAIMAARAASGPSTTTSTSYTCPTTFGSTGGSGGRVGAGRTRRACASLGAPAPGVKVFSNGNKYEGSMYEGQMHGQGSYAWQDGCEYEGEFYQNRMSGLGEKRWPCGRRYCGEWREDMMWGKGEMLWPSGQSYVGQFRKGVFHGNGVRVWPNGDRYVGEFRDGALDGEGSLQSAAEGWSLTGHWQHGRMYGEGECEWPDGIVYKGEWQDGIREGHGRLTWPNGSCYEGPFSRNCIQGRGRKAFPGGAWYEGEFDDGEFEGQGIFRWADGVEFEGLWHQSEIVGPGCQRLPDGTTITATFEDHGAMGMGTKRWTNGCVFEGMLENSQVGAHGTLTWPDGRRYTGRFEDGAMQGHGKLEWHADGGLCVYEGEFRENRFEGAGKLRWPSGACFEGEMQNGQYHGIGSFTWPGGSDHYKGRWVHGEMSGHGALMCRDVDDMGSSYLFAGNFVKGQMEGHGQVIFHSASGGHDMYRGEFQASRFGGLGVFIWDNGESIAGLFEDRYCSRVGRKIYVDGRVYTGELRYDLENGKGVLQEPSGSIAFAGVWEDGKPMEELHVRKLPRIEIDLDALYPTDGMMIPEADGESWINFISEGADFVIPSRQGTSEGLEREAASGFTRVLTGTFVQPSVATSAALASLLDAQSSVIAPADRESSETASDHSSDGDSQLGSSISGDSETLARPIRRKAKREVTSPEPSDIDLLTVRGDDGIPLEGKASIAFKNGARYIGYMSRGRKHGFGMYVYPDRATYRGNWEEDVLNGIRHPVSEPPQPVQVLLLHSTGPGIVGPCDSGPTATEVSGKTSPPTKTLRPSTPSSPNKAEGARFRLGGTS